MKADAQTAKDVAAVVEKLTGAYKARKLDEMLACFAFDEDTVLIGTGADEKRIGPAQIRAQAERDWAQTENVEMDVAWRPVSAAGGVAWIFGDGAFRIRAGGQAMALPARVSMVLEKRDGK